MAGVRRPAVCFALPFLACAVLLPFCGGCRPSLANVDGPEATDLVQGVSGFIITSRSRGELAATSLPALEEVTLRAAAPEGQDFPQARAVSGPDEQGRVAFIDDGYFANEERHYLKTMSLDTKQEQEVFSRPGAALWTRHIGEHLALAPVGGRAAFVGEHAGVQMHDPAALLEVGPLEVWDVAKKTGRKAGIDALDGEMSWFPDGKRLAYVELVPRKEVEGQLAKLGGFGFKAWEKVPAVHVLDADTGKKRLLHPGWSPRVSADGKSVLASDFDNRFRLIDAASGESEAADWPGRWGGVIALLEGKRILYWGLPTKGAPARYTHLGSRGPQQLVTLKLAVIGTGKFQTVVPYIDARNPVSFGRGKSK